MLTVGNYCSPPLFNFIAMCTNLNHISFSPKDNSKSHVSFSWITIPPAAENMLLSKKRIKVYVAQYQNVGNLQSLFSCISPLNVYNLFTNDISLTILLTPIQGQRNPTKTVGAWAAAALHWSRGCAELEWLWGDTPCPGGSEAPARW